MKKFLRKLEGSYLCCSLLIYYLEVPGINELYLSIKWINNFIIISMNKWMFLDERMNAKVKVVSFENQVWYLDIWSLVSKLLFYFFFLYLMFCKNINQVVTTFNDFYMDLIFTHLSVCSIKSKKIGIHKV